MPIHPHRVHLSTLDFYLIPSHRLGHSVFGKVHGNVRFRVCRRTSREDGWLVGVFQCRSFVEDTKRGGGAVFSVEEG